MSNDTNQLSGTSPISTGYQRDYVAVLPEASAIPDDELLSAPTEAQAISAAVFSKKEVLDELDPKAERLPDFKLEDFRKLQQRTRALCHADTLLASVSNPPAPIAGKQAQLAKVKTRLIAECELLVVKEVLDGKAVEELRFNTNDRQVASNVRVITNVLDEQWERVAPHTTMKREELAQFASLAEEVHEALAHREAQPKRIADATRTRRQIFTLTLRSLSAVEQAVFYYHRDKFDYYMPDVYAKLGRRRGKLDELVVTPAAPAAAPAQPTSVQLGAAAAPAVPVGMPGSNPFTV